MRVPTFMLWVEKSTVQQQQQKVIQLTLACLYQRARATCRGCWGSRQALEPFHHNFPTNSLQMWHVMKIMRPDVVTSGGHVCGIGRQCQRDLTTAIKRSKVLPLHGHGLLINQQIQSVFQWWAAVITHIFRAMTDSTTSCYPCHYQNGVGFKFNWGLINPCVIHEHLKGKSLNS